MRLSTSIGEDRPRIGASYGEIESICELPLDEKLTAWPFDRLGSTNWTRMGDERVLAARQQINMLAGEPSDATLAQTFRAARHYGESGNLPRPARCQRAAAQMWSRPT